MLAAIPCVPLFVSMAVHVLVFFFSLAASNSPLIIPPKKESFARNRLLILIVQRPLNPHFQTRQFGQALKATD